MEDAQLLLVLAVTMFFGSFLAGSIPLAFSLSEHHLNLASSFGAGILVGTALIIILPEGVATLYGGGLNQCAAPEGHSMGHGHDHSSGEGGEVQHFEAEWAMGFSLVLGFAVMFLIDQFGPSHRRTSSSLDTEPTTKNFKSAFFGLLVHAAADGIALGAASMGDNSGLEMVVFFAIMLHKAPGSFGLATYLLHEGLTRNTVRMYLAIFSCAAPISSLLTYGILNGYQFDTPQHIWTGLVLLFSAGSFLYVATIHVLPEIISGHSHHGDHSHSLTTTQSLFVLAGLFSPLFLSVNHGH